MPRGHVVFENLFGEHGAIGELDLPACASLQRTPLEQLAFGYSCDWSVREQGSFVGFVLRGPSPPFGLNRGSARAFGLARCSNELRFTRTLVCGSCSSARRGTSCAMRWLRRAARQWGARSARPVVSGLPTWFRFAVGRKGVGFGWRAAGAVAAVERVCGEGGGGGVVDGVGEGVEVGVELENGAVARKGSTWSSACTRATRGGKARMMRSRTSCRLCFGGGSMRRAMGCRLLWRRWRWGMWRRLRPRKGKQVWSDVAVEVSDYVRSASSLVVRRTNSFAHKRDKPLLLEMYIGGQDL